MTSSLFMSGVRITLLAWLAVLGFDFFLHAGLLAPFYREPTAFLLPEKDLFKRIPLGYISFLIQILMLRWILVAAGVTGLARGALYGLVFGILFWGSFLLGLASVASASVVLLLAWFIGQSTELAVAGAVLGAGLDRGRGGGLGWRVICWVIACVIAGVLLQNL